MSARFLLFLLTALTGLLASSCSPTPQREVVLPTSSEHSRPWNDMNAGEGQGMLGGFAR